jgi:hypothetical protein
MASAALSAAMLLVFGAFECRAVRERDSVAEVSSLLDAALPQGSSRDDITRYLGAHGLEYHQKGVSESSAQTTTFEAAKVTAGTNVILTNIYQDGTLFWLGPRELEVVFVLNNDATLERISIVPYEVE